MDEGRRRWYRGRMRMGGWYRHRGDRSKVGSDDWKINEIYMSLYVMIQNVKLNQFWITFWISFPPIHFWLIHVESIKMTQIGVTLHHRKKKRQNIQIWGLCRWFTSQRPSLDHPVGLRCQLSKRRLAHHPGDRWWVVKLLIPLMLQKSGVDSPVDMVVYPIILRRVFSTIPGGAGFLPSTVLMGWSCSYVKMFFFYRWNGISSMNPTKLVYMLRVRIPQAKNNSCKGFTILIHLV